VTFVRPFVFEGLDEPQPAGSYVVETHEELLDTMLTPAYRRMSTVIHLHAKPGMPGVIRIAAVDPLALDAALARDRDPPKAKSPPERRWMGGVKREKKAGKSREAT
jgi:hypothetical protein